MKHGIASGATLIGLAVAGYWLFWPSDPNSICSESGVRDEVRRLIGSLTPVGKALDAMSDPNWKPELPPQPVGSNAYIPPPPKKIERPTTAEISRVRRDYVQLDGSSLAVAYDRDLGRVTCRVRFNLDNQAIAEAASSIEAFAPVARLAEMSASIGQLKAIFQQDQARTATYTVQPSDRRGMYAITVEPLGAGL